ncbi:MAG: MBL fold metallo-hydrolase [Butyricimonas faecihominis]
MRGNFWKRRSPRRQIRVCGDSLTNAIHGLFEVVSGAIYQVRGFDLANMTLYERITDGLLLTRTTSEASALAGYRLVKQHLGDLPVRALIITHPHIDHYGEWKPFVGKFQIKT